MSKSYDPFLVGLSVLIAIWASYDALLLAGRMRVAASRSRPVWLIAGSLALGVGIWSMHFVGMLALRLPVAVYYDGVLVGLSALVAIAASAVAFALVSRGVTGHHLLWAGGISMGAAISGMHYIGMASMRLPAAMHYDPLLVALSIAIASGLAFGALWLVFQHHSPVFRHDRWRKLEPAVLMGLGIVGMHYTAMAAATFIPAQFSPGRSLGHLVPATSEFATLVALGTAAMLGMAQLGVIISRREEQVQQTEDRFRLLVDRVREYAILMLDPEGQVVTWNEGARRITGYTAAEALGQHYSRIYPAEGVAQGTPQSQLQIAAASGHVEAEGWRLRKDGSHFWANVFITPIRDSTGALVGFSNVTRDVTERKRAARKLRRAREQATEARFVAKLDERTRLAHELHDTLLQGFTGVGLNLVAVTNRLNGPPEIVAALRDLIGSAQKTLENARRAIWDIRPTPRAGEDFATTLGAAAENGVRGTGLSLNYAVNGSARPAEPDVEHAVVRVALEAIANAVKHAAARTLRLGLTYEPKRLRLSVSDDGRGFTVDPDFRAYSGHLGLLGMQERASEAHGTLSVRSSPGHGTEIVLLVPYAGHGRAGPPSPVT